MQPFAFHGLVVPTPVGTATPSFGRHSLRRYGGGASATPIDVPRAEPAPDAQEPRCWVDQEFEEPLFE